MPKKVLPEHWKLAERLADLIQENNPKARITGGQITKWADIVRLIVERDKQTLEDVRKVVEWSQSHHFWSTVILSMRNLRENWNKLTVQMDPPKLRKKRSWEEEIRDQT